MHEPVPSDVTVVLRALADPIRLDIVRQLYDAPSAIACGRFDTTVAKNTLSHHLKILREAGIIATHREGGQLFNVLCDDELESAYPGLLRALFKVRNTVV